MRAIVYTEYGLADVLQLKGVENLETQQNRSKRIKK
jgi:hypothetical protein